MVFPRSQRQFRVAQRTLLFRLFTDHFSTSVTDVIFGGMPTLVLFKRENLMWALRQLESSPRLAECRGFASFHGSGR